MPNRILVTGSSGFIGVHLVKTLISHGYVVHGTDVRMPAFSANNFHFVKCDIVNADELRQVLSNCQPHAVVHLAARTDLDGKGIDEYAANVAGVQNLVETIADTPSVQRCIYTSSQLVCRVGYVPKDDQDYCPNTIYGESKVLTEQITKQHDGGGREWCLVRPTTVWGAGIRPHYQHFFRMISQGRYFFVGRRPLFKSYSYVGNIVYQYQKILEASTEQVHRKTFYLADYEPISLRAWVNAFQRELGARPVPTVPEPFAKVMACLGDMINLVGVKSFPFNSFRLKNILTEYQFDLANTEKVCGPLPYNMEQGVQETAVWIRTLLKNEA
ncbi:MAG: NAD-dependent epimerase/dehydratase family protein [Planctomycetes bacterium]|nr:NAD-dependent epimerase/dehydratase family protein [Planctomycetota bacterium]